MSSRSILWPPFTPDTLTKRRPPSAVRRGVLGSPAVLLVAAWCWMTATVATAAPLTRAAAIQMGLERNPQISASLAQVEQARARRGQVHAARYPSINLIAGVGPSMKARLEPGSAIQSTESAYTGLGFDDLSVVFGGQAMVVQPLYTFGKIDERDEATRHEIRARESQADMTRADVALRIAELYETVLFARDAMWFFDEMIHGLQTTMKRTETEVAEEKRPEQDLLRLQSAQTYLEIGLNQARTGLAQATAGLTAYLGLPKGSSIELADEHLELVEVSQFDERRLLATALGARPELKALKEGQAAFERLADAEAAGNLPDVFAAAFASGAYTPGRDLVDTRFASDPLMHFVPGALLGVRWEFQPGRADQRAQEHRAKALELRHVERWAELGVPAELTVALKDLARTRHDADSTDIAVKRAKRWSIQAAADYALGLSDAREVQDATAAYVQLRLGNLRARLEYNLAVAKLAKVTGTLTTKGAGPYPPQD